MDTKEISIEEKLREYFKAIKDDIFLAKYVRLSEVIDTLNECIASIRVFSDAKESLKNFFKNRVQVSSEWIDDKYLPVRVVDAKTYMSFLGILNGAWKEDNMDLSDEAPFKFSIDEMKFIYPENPDKYLPVSKYMLLSYMDHVNSVEHDVLEKLLYGNRVAMFFMIAIMDIDTDREGDENG